MPHHRPNRFSIFRASARIFFATAGRVFTAADDANAPKVVNISQELARKFFAGRDPLGGHLKLGTAGGTMPLGYSGWRGR